MWKVTSQSNAANNYNVKQLLSNAQTPTASITALSVVAVIIYSNAVVLTLPRGTFANTCIRFISSMFKQAQLIYL